MTHLNITQGSTVETVSALIIKKLYETALTVSEPLEGETDAAYMSGHISVPHTYAEYVEYLAGEIGEGNSGVVTSRIQNPTGRFQDLTIDVTNGIYINFEDPLVESILATNFGDGVGIIQTTAASITSFGGKFANSNIVSFNELSQFTNITEINSNNRFSSCTSLTSIDLSNITKISGKDGYQRWNFENCTNLESIGNTLNLTYLGYNAFLNCSKLKHIYTSNVTEFRSNCLLNCTGILDAIVLNQYVTYIGDNAFSSVPTLPDVINLPNLESIGQDAFRNTTIKHVVDLGKITTIGSVWSAEGQFTNCSELLDAIIPETVTTVKYGLFFGCNELRWIKLLSTSLPTYVTIDGHGNSKSYGVAFGENYRDEDPTNTYQGNTYPIYVKDELLSQYQAADGWKYVGPGRLRPLSQFTTDFPNG